MATKKKINEPVINDDDGDEDDVPDYATHESVNKAIGARLARIEKSFDEKLGAITSKFEEMLTKMVPAEQDPKAKDEASAQITQLQKKIDAEKARNDAMEQERAREKEEAKAAKREGAVRDALAKVGIANPTVAKAAAGLLIGSVKHNDEGQIVFVKPNKAGYDDELEVEAAVSEWAKTDDGKAFMPAKPVKGAGGSRPDVRTAGQQNSGRQGKDDGKVTKADKVAAARDFLKSQFAPLLGHGVADE